MGDEEAPLNPQRRLRHLCGVVGRNLTPLVHQGELRPYHSFFTLSTAPGKAPFYTSETVFNSINPTWREFDLTEMKDVLNLGSSKFVVRVWGAYFNVNRPPPENAFKLVIQWNIDLYGLDFYSSKLEETGPAKSGPLPSDSILVHLTCGYFYASNRDDTPKGLDVSSTSAMAYSKVDRTRVRNTYSKASLVRILTLQRSIQRVRTNTEVITDQTEHCLKTQQAEHDLRAAVEKMRMVVAVYQDDVRQRQKECDARKARLETNRASLSQRQSLVRESHTTLGTTRDELREMRDKLRERRQLQWQAKSMETVRQTRIILELSQIFPIQQGPPPGRAWSICRLELPTGNDYAGWDEDEVATALGYVSHLSFMIAKYLGVPFRFPMRPMCSRSVIVDDMSANPSDEDRVFPLYAHGRNKGRFENAVTMLNLNIEQLLSHCGIKGSGEANPLAQLHVLMRHFFQLNHAHTSGQLTQLTSAAPVPTQ
eukprot:m.180643 g.180643  ORF g.180643 m.180643 type:complete len:481 (-) comp15052_c0_seq1:219-1661(-)